MEWKEHIAWFAQILATVVAYLVWKYGPELARNDKLRNMAIWIFIIAFVTAGIAGLFGFHYPRRRSVTTLARSSPN